ncbi:F-box/LRR-repeat protein At3g59190 [Gossypium raimondii]|uniref:F-box/LRR-repeat protein At3g59190 n=1 Tax=Gossypium raimondii TaxID=29730 RepID=UPI00227C321C|nr:F-box/LRR-repeat protein At3g59190 [Gossypium raimondii]
MASSTSNLKIRWKLAQGPRYNPMAIKRKQGSANAENLKTSSSPSVFLFYVRDVKARRIDEEDLADRLSELPDHVILHIMSFLPIKEAVRTCLLSTRWKDLFTSISNIELDGVLRNKALRNRFMKFSDGFLSLRKDISVDRFRLCCGPGIDHRKINEWILYAVRHGVRELDLIFQSRSFETRHFTELEFTVFTCKTLLTLRLFNLPSLVLTIPTHCCLPKLKVLHLTFLKFSDDESIRRLLSSCNSLEELLVQSCELSNLNKLSVCHPTLKRLTINGGHIDPICELEINTPNLVCFDFGYFYCEETRLSLINLNSLSEARIWIGFIAKMFSNFCNDTASAFDLMRALSCVQSFHLTGICLEVQKKSFWISSSSKKRNNSD